FCLNDCGDDAPAGAENSLAAPTNLVAMLTKSGKGKDATSTVTLSWTDNSNVDYSEDVFAIERCEEFGRGKDTTCLFYPIGTVGQNVTSFSEVAGSGTFRYRVKARIIGVEDSAYSNEVEI
ncbi:MAG: hypothetical protein P8Y54_13175, partial [Xanthomonadales bacterium]